MPPRSAFFALPTELRQQILLGLNNDSDLKLILTRYPQRFQDSPAIRKKNLFATLSSAYPITEFSEDMDYVIKKWMERIEVIEAEPGWKRMQRIRANALSFPYIESYPDSKYGKYRYRTDEEIAFSERTMRLGCEHARWREVLSREQVIWNAARGPFALGRYGSADEDLTTTTMAFNRHCSSLRREYQHNEIMEDLRQEREQESKSRQAKQRPMDSRMVDDKM